jgi:hypothetical protein
MNGVMQRLFGTRSLFQTSKVLLIEILICIPLISTSFASDLTVTYQIPLTNISTSIAYYYSGAQSDFLVGGAFDVPLIDPSKFTIISATFEWDEVLGAADWVPVFDFQNDLKAAILLTRWAGQSLLQGEGNNLNQGGSASFSYWTLISGSAASFDPGINLTNCYIGSPKDRGGYLQIFATNDINNTGSWGNGHGPANQLNFIASSILLVTYGLNTNSSGWTVSNLPPVVSASSNLIIRQTPNTLVPSSVDLPPSVLHAAGLYISQIQQQGGNILVSWNTLGGTTNYVQATTSMADPYFTNISGPIVIPGTNMVSTNFVIIGDATNRLSHFYRIFLAQ